MNERRSNFKANTVGSLPCEKSLGAMLSEINDSRVIRPTMSRLTKHRQSISEIAQSKLKKPLKLKLMELINREVKSSVTKMNPDRVPNSVSTTLLCCIAAHYRIAVKKVKSVE